MQEILSRESIGSRIRSLRIQNGFSQEFTAKFLGMSRGNYSQIEIGNQFPTYEILYKLALFYGRTYDWLLHGHPVANAEIPDMDLPRPSLGSAYNLIHMVPIAEYYNYLSKKNKRSFIDTLNPIVIPENSQMTYVNGIYRAFEVADFGMAGIVQKEDLITARNVMNSNEIVLDKIYVIVTPDEILIRRIVNYFADSNVLICKADNPSFPLSVIKLDEVKELWQMWEIISTKIGGLVEEMQQRVKHFEKTVSTLRTKVEDIRRERLEVEKSQEDATDEISL